MSKFWHYFSKVLCWPFLRDPALAVIVKGLAHYFDAIREDIIYAQRQFHVELADDIDPHAESRGLRRHRLDTDEQYRSRAVNAYRWQRHGAKEQGLPIILSDYGYAGARVTYSDDPAKWAEFGISFAGYGANVLGILSVINEFKPARSKLSAIDTPAHSAGSYTVLGYSRLQDSIDSYRRYEAATAIVGYVRLQDSIASYASPRRGLEGLSAQVRREAHRDVGG